MQITCHTPDDLEQLQHNIRLERHATQRDRYRAVLLALQRHSAPAIMDKLGRRRHFVQHGVNSSALLAPTVNTAYMNHHLRFISEQAGPDVHVVLVLDQAGWHTSKGLQVPANITLLYLPAYSPELNPIERLWSYIKSHYLSNRIYTDYEDLLEAGRHAWNCISPERFRSICRARWIPHQN